MPLCLCDTGDASEQPRYSRRLAGWSIAEHMRTDLVTDALKGAAATRGGTLRGAIFHSDNGAQASRQFAELCDDLVPFDEFSVSCGFVALWVRWLARSVLVGVVYWWGRGALGVHAAVARGDGALMAEVLVLRHENVVLRRQIGRVRYGPADRAWFAASSVLIPARSVVRGLLRHARHGAGLVPSARCGQVHRCALGVRPAVHHGSGEVADGAGGPR
jgi:hypothetical protein